jgi:hypothetical protein
VQAELVGEGKSLQGRIVRDKLPEQFAVQVPDQLWIESFGSS